MNYLVEETKILMQENWLEKSKSENRHIILLRRLFIMEKIL